MKKILTVLLLSLALTSCAKEPEEIKPTETQTTIKEVDDSNQTDENIDQEENN